MKKHLLFLAVFTYIFTALIGANQEARLLRFPAVYENQIVFTYAGDLYTVTTQGGTARKLTTHQGFEMFPRFSHDGKFIAFTGQYDGNTEVYLMPSEGGRPKRLTYTATLSRDDVSDRMGPNNIVMGWKHNNQQIVFRSRMIEHNSFNGQLFLTTVDGDLPVQLPLPRGGFCSYSPDDTKLAYNRVFREFRTWKRYRGGMADDIWIHDFISKKTVNITDNPAQDIIPMWMGDKIYFLSDRDKGQKMNLYAYDLITKNTAKLTEFKLFDIKFPSHGKGQIAFENGGYIYVYDTAAQKLKKVSVTINDDLIYSRQEIKKVKKFITNYEISPDGKRALFGARGEVFTVPLKNGNTRNLTKTSGIHERGSKWSPNGKWIAFISDQSGENEIYIKTQDGRSEAQKITAGADTYKYSILWSPDSKKILWSDKKLRLRYIDITDKKIREVTQAKAWEIRNFSWSPDSNWIAYSKQLETGFGMVFLYSLKQKTNYQVTDNWYSSQAPCFDTDGKYLLFVSNRDFRPIYSWTEWNHAYQDMSRIYLVTLARDTLSPFKPKSDEVAVKKGTLAKNKNIKQSAKKGDKKGSGSAVVVKVDPKGLIDRIIGLPIKPAGYRNISAVKEKVYYMKRSSGSRMVSLMMYDLKKLKETDLGQINGYEISADAKKMLVSKANTYAIINLPAAKIQLKETLKLDGLEMLLCRKCEWKNIFFESWRQMRDFFYAPNMHGVDWNAIKDKYAPLVKHVNHRADLTYILGEMIGELNVGHTYVGGGDSPKANRIKTGLLGARLQKEPKTGFYRISKILKGQNWNKAMISPLTAIGVNVSEGDYILEVNGQSTAKMSNIFQSLVNTQGKQVELRVNSAPMEKGSRKVVVVPVADEHNLYYFNWVRDNIDKVSKATGGKVGYIHIPDMGVPGLNEFVKYYYPQLLKKALIIDVRGNGGGSVSPMIIERLRREIVMVGMARNTLPSTDPDSLMMGPLVCLMDEFSASDGDIFPYRFKKYKLGKLIGKRSWGGVVGIRGSLPFLDGGYLYKPEFAIYSAEGKKWIVEGIGVEPDIYVDNDPAKEFAGIDQQLNKGIEVILQELKLKEKTLPPIPPYPDKSAKKKKLTGKN